jgi:hypothetical protein
VFLFSLSIILESNKNVDEGYLHGIVFSASYIGVGTDCYDGIKKLNEIKTESVLYKLSSLLYSKSSGGLICYGGRFTL